MSSLDLTRDWLKSVLRPYPSRDRILSEILDIIQHHRTLAVKTDAFTFDSGQTALLLLLHGTLPITYRGAVYQIPLHVWLPLEYPRSPPMAFVVPTKDMGVRKGHEVEPGGRVRDEIVSQWWTSWQTKDVETLLKYLTEIFSKVPPVYAKPPEPITSTPQTVVSSASLAPTPVSPSPPVRSPVAVSPQSGPPPPARPLFVAPNGHAEALPQYRAAPTPPPQMFANTHSRQASGSYPLSHPQYTPQLPLQPGPVPGQSNSPPIPSRPVQSPSQHPSVQHPPVPQRPFQGRPPIEVATQGHPMTPPRPVQSPAQYQSPPRPALSAPGNIPPWLPGATASPPPPSPTVPFQSPPSGWQAPVAFQSGHVQQPLTPSSVVAPPRLIQAAPQATPDLLSSPEQSVITLPDASLAPATAPPPLPPSKPPPPSLLHLHSILLPHLTAALPPLLSSLQSQKAHHLERREDLVTGEPAIRDEMARLEAVKKVCDSVGQKMSDVVERGSQRVADLENRGDVSVDEVVCGISIVHNQLIDLVAEDNALEDTIYHITRALDAERIDLERYLKSIRSLAREQYMKRALIERILQGMGQTQGW